MSLKTVPSRYKNTDHGDMPVCDFSVSSKASPRQVMEEVNATLKANGILIAFVMQDSESSDPRFDLHM